MLHTVFVWLHMLAAVVWIGGMAFLSLVLVPSLGAMNNQAGSQELLRLAARRFQRIVWASIVVLIGTGMVNLIALGQGPGFETTFGRILSIKLILVALMLVLTTCHSAAAQQAYRGFATRWIPRLNLLLGILVLLCAVTLSRSG
jgi:copper resistance protein D